MNACSEVDIRGDSFRLASYVVAGLGLATAAAAGSMTPLLALVPVAIVLGWSHLSSV